MAESTVYIYALGEPDTGDVRYVGKSVRPTRRWKCYCRDRTPTKRGRWLRELEQRGLRPLLYLLEVVDGDWVAAERRWIALYRSEGADLLNANGGGGGPIFHSTETRAKMSAASQKRHAAKNGTWAAMGGVPAEVKAKIGAANSKNLKGRKLPPEHRAAIAKGMQKAVAEGRWISQTKRPEVRAKIAATLRGRPVLLLTCEFCGKEIRGGKWNLAQHQASPKKCATPPGT